MCQELQFTLMILFKLQDNLRVCAESLQSCLTLRPHGLQPAMLLCPEDSPGKNTEMGCHALLQRMFPTQEANPHLLCLLNWQTGFLPLVQPGKPFKESCVCVCVCVYVCISHSVVSNSLHPRGLEPARLLSPWNSPGKNTGVGSHSLSQDSRGS